MVGGGGVTPQAVVPPIPLTQVLKTCSRTSSTSSNEVGGLESRLGCASASPSVRWVCVRPSHRAVWEAAVITIVSCWMHYFGAP